MKAIDSKIYDKNYYLNSNLGSDEFKKYKAKKVHPRIKEFADLLIDVKGKKILDMGCGRGDLAIELARRGARVVGVDYSSDGIELARDVLRYQSSLIQKNVKFYVRDAKKLNLKNNSFDVIVSYDVFEHLYKEELDIVMKGFVQILKPNGSLLVHTETNKIYLNYTHKFWCYWIDLILLKFNTFISGNKYPGLNKDPRNDLHKAQHVNEPTYFYLRSLFMKYNFEGKINSIVPYKPNLSWKDKTYNVLVYLFPISSYAPLNWLFTTEYVCFVKLNK